MAEELLLRWAVTDTRIDIVALQGEVVCATHVLTDAAQWATADSLLGFSIVTALRTLWDDMPYARVRSEVRAAQELPLPLRNTVALVQTLFEHGARLLEAVLAEPESAHTDDAVGFLIPRGSVILHAYAAAARQCGLGRVVVREFDTTWNSQARTFSGTFDALAPDVLSWLRAERVRTVVTHNTYVLDLNLREGFHLLQMARRLGIEWITCDFDTYEGVIEEQLVIKDEPTFRRFTIEPHNTAEWLTYFSRQVWSPLPVRLGMDLPPACRPVAPGSPLIFASNARLDGVLRKLPTLLYLLDACDPRHLYRDATLWYYAMRRLVMRDNREAAPIIVNRWIGRLFFLYLDLISLMKYLLLDQLVGRYPVLLYGDSQWSALFPQLYQHRYLTEADYVATFSAGNAIGLLANHNFSYVANNPVFGRALELGSPFFCYESIVCTPDYAPFRQHEYCDVDDLLAKLPQVNGQATSGDLRDCRMRYMMMHREYAAQFARGLFTSALPEHTQFVRDYAAHDALWYPQIDAYLAQHTERLVRAISLVAGDRSPPDDPLRTSRYADTAILGRLRSIAQQQGVVWPS